MHNLVNYGKVSLTYKGKPQKLQMPGKSGTTRDHVPHLLPYGFTANPHQGAESLTVNLAGDAAQGLCIVVSDRRYHLQVEQGEVAIYDDLKQKVHLTRDGIVIHSSKKLTIDTPTTHITGDVIIDKECTISGIAFTPHVHPESIGSQTGAPQ